MTLEELIRKRFITLEEIAGKLAQYAGVPAVFLQSAPADTQAGWGNGTQYPRIINTVELRADNERKRQGQLTVDLYCDLAKSVPEDIEPLIRAALKDIVFQPDEASPFCFAWRSTEAFELETSSTDKDMDKRIAGYELFFDILEYPDQITTEPDPVESMSRWLKKLFPDAFVIGVDEIDEYQTATEDQPILFVRSDSYTQDHISYALAWINCILAVHVIAPTASARSRWTRCIMNALLLHGELPMTDGTPLRFTGNQASNASDYLITGQISVSGQYTLPRYRQDGAMLYNPKAREERNNGR